MSVISKTFTEGQICRSAKGISKCVAKSKHQTHDASDRGREPGVEGILVSPSIKGVALSELLHDRGS